MFSSLQTPATSESADQMDEEPPKTASEEVAPVQPIPPAASTQLLSLMHQLEENGVQVALGDMEVIPSDPVPPTSVSVGSKRKRIPSDDSKQQKKKCTPTSSPSRSTVDIPSVEMADQVPTNVAVVQPMQSNSTPAIPQTLSISQINQISSTISSVISQSVESSCTKKTPTPVIFPNQSKNATSSSESSLTEESHNPSKEIATAKAQTVSSSPKVVEPKVVEPKIAEPNVVETKVAELKVVDPKVAEPKATEPKVIDPKVVQPKVVEPKVVQPKVAEPKVVQPKIVEPKVVEPKKSATVLEKEKVVNASKMVEKPANVITSRPAENLRTYSRRDESSNQKATPKPSKVNAQGSEAANKLPAKTAESSQVKDAAVAATATHPVPTQSSTTSSPAPAKQPASTTKAASQANSANPVLLRPHHTAVRCVFIYGPCAFTASEDGTVHIYDLKTNSLSMRILGHTQPVTWLYGISLTTSNDVLNTLKSTTDYLNHVTLITGSEDAHIRQFALESGSLMHERFCNYALTCAVGHKSLAKLYVGTTVGTIFAYNPRINSMRISKFKVG